MSKTFNKIRNFLRRRNGAPEILSTAAENEGDHQNAMAAGQQNVDAEIHPGSPFWQNTEEVDMEIEQVKEMITDNQKNNNQNDEDDNHIYLDSQQIRNQIARNLRRGDENNHSDSEDGFDAPPPPRRNETQSDDMIIDE